MRRSRFPKDAIERSFRVSKADWALWQAAAKAKGWSTSRWIRRVCNSRIKGKRGPRAVNRFDLYDSS